MPIAVFFTLKQRNNDKKSPQMSYIYTIETNVENGYLDNEIKRSRCRYLRQQHYIKYKNTIHDSIITFVR